MFILLGHYYVSFLVWQVYHPQKNDVVVKT